MWAGSLSRASEFLVFNLAFRRRIRLVGKGYSYAYRVERSITAALLVADTILAARTLAQYEGGTRFSATVSAIADAVRWAEQIMAEIDRRWPVRKSEGCRFDEIARNSVES